MKKHFKAYISGWPARRSLGGVGDGAKELRMKLMETESVSQARDVLQCACWHSLK
jgi:hypothetical protein